MTAIQPALNKKAVYIGLLVLNLALLATLIVIVMQQRNTSVSPTRFVTVIEKGASGALPDEVRQHLVKEAPESLPDRLLLFFYQSADTLHVEGLLRGLAACRTTQTDSVAVLLIGPPEVRVPIEWQAGRTDSTLRVAAWEDASNQLRQTFSVFKVATVLLDVDRGVVLESFPFLLNPFVLCENYLS